MRTLYSEQLINQIQNRSFGAEGHGGGGALSAGNPNQNYPNQGRAGSGKYIVWATPDISAKIPQMNRTPFGTSNSGNLDGGSDDANTSQYNRGWYAAGGCGSNNGIFVARGGWTREI